jgi:hypothetical protein
MARNVRNIVKKKEYQINKYCLDLVMYSDIEEWYEFGGDRYITKGNIEIYCKPKFFYIKIRYDNEYFNSVSYEHTIYFNIKSFRQYGFNYMRRLRVKRDYINSYLKNKKEIERVNLVYNSLPVKKIRKDKLENLKNK